jgi:hypothetical protein
MQVAEIKLIDVEGFFNYCTVVASGIVQEEMDLSAVGVTKPFTNLEHQDEVWKIYTTKEELEDYFDSFATASGIVYNDISPGL